MMSSSFTASSAAGLASTLGRSKRAVRRCISRFLADEDGVALVEFAITLPMMMLVFAVIIEGSRMMLSYESAINGVRDATRYLARITAPDICTTGGSVAGEATKLKTLIVQASSGASIFVSDVTIGTVTPTYRCVSGTYRGGSVPVAQVTAQLTITFPFAGIFTFVGGSRPTIATTVTDQARVFGS